MGCLTFIKIYATLIQVECGGLLNRDILFANDSRRDMEGGSDHYPRIYRVLRT